MTPTPSQKAEDLIQMYLSQTIHFPYIDLENDHCIGSGPMTFYSAVRCAIIAVDEMLEVLCVYEDISKDYQYWKEVKQELKIRLPI